MAPRTPIPALPALPPTTSLLATLRSLGAPYLVDEDRGADQHWTGGVEWDPETCGASGTSLFCGDPTTKEIDERRGILEASAFAVWAGDKCSAFDYQADQYETRARNQLRACQSFRVSEELWDGALASANSYPTAYFTQSGLATAITDADGLTPVDALGCLELYLARNSCGAPGMIHATASVVTQWISHQLVRREGSVLRTLLDTIIVTDGGYSGAAPADSTDEAGVSWAYATDYIQVRLGPVEFYSADRTERMDWAANTIYAIAERPALAIWDQCRIGAIGVQVDSCEGVGS